ncbi:MAG: hypothetical protein N2483_11075 [Burkholderiaceae bacterium]|nr:hypothetical protein [Burkholderiaceae bacterium]
MSRSLPSLKFGLAWTDKCAAAPDEPFEAVLSGGALGPRRKIASRQRIAGNVKRRAADDRVCCNAGSAFGDIDLVPPACRLAGLGGVRAVAADEPKALAQRPVRCGVRREFFNRIGRLYGM